MIDDFLNSFVPKAQPFNWNEGSDDNSNNAHNAAAPLLPTQNSTESIQFQPALESCNNIGTGLAWIQYLVEEGSPDEISDGAKSILSDLFHSSGAFNVSMIGDGQIDNPPPLITKIFQANKASELDEYDCKMVEKKRLTDKAKSGKVSLFCTILRLFQNSNLAISAHKVLEECTMSISPKDIPPELTSRQMVYAALSFLSSSIPSLVNIKEDANGKPDSYEQMLISSIFPKMPLLKQVGKSEKSDIESIEYRKCTESVHSSCTLENESFRRKVIHLEKVFLSSSTKYPNRMNLCPRSNSIAKESAIICRGSYGSAKVEKKKASTLKRKAESIKSKSDTLKKVCSDI